MKKKVFAMIPARIGSTRLKLKNLALINGRPMIYYAIQAAKDSNIFDKIIINSDSETFRKIAERYGVEFYLRPKELGGSNIKSDDVVLDFIEKHKTDIVAWVNPISPLQTGSDIRNIINHFQQNNFNSLITVVERQAHCIHNQIPINFELKRKFAQTQDLIPIQEMVYSIMMWDTSSYLKAMELSGSAILHGNICYYPINKLKSLIVKNHIDLMIVDSIMKINDKNQNEIKYDDISLSKEY